MSGMKFVRQVCGVWGIYKNISRILIKQPAFHGKLGGVFLKVAELSSDQKALVLFMLFCRMGCTSHWYQYLPSRELTYPPDKAYLKMIFLFPRWDMLISWRV